MVKALRSYGSKYLLPTYSVDLLESLKGSVISKAYKVLERDTKKMLTDHQIVHNKMFELAYARLYIELDDGRVICLFNDMRRTSVTITVVLPEVLLEQVRGKQIIDCSDKVYSHARWARLIGQTIISINIFKVLEADLNMGMNERGLQFNCDSDEFLFSSCLVHRGPTDTVLSNISDIADIYAGKLEIIKNKSEAEIVNQIP